MGHSAVPSISGQPAPQVIHRKQSMQQFQAYQQQLQQQQAQAQAQAQVQPQYHHHHHQHTASTASSVASSSTGHEGDSENASYNGQGSIQSMLDLYEVGEVIGTGTFGIIRKVTRKTDGLVLARKELDYGRMDERDLKQLSEEVNILQNLEPNENIVRYYERYVDRQKFRLHIIMEYCHNGDLAAQIQRCRRKNTLLREELVWSYLTQIALALSMCHAELDARGHPKQVILHRDIKPENVFLDKDGVLKLGDFGLSKAMSNAAFTNTYVGTPYYMSPELINSQAYDNKSDIWALGCLIYELCAWHPPFHEARTQAELTKLIRDGRIPPLPNQYSRSLQDVVKSMLRQDPKQRPSIEMLKSLDEVKLQMRVIEMRRMHEELLKCRREVEVREAAVAEREQLLLARERDLAIERSDLAEQQMRLQQAYSTFQSYQISSSSSSSQGSTSTAPSSRDNSPLMDQKEINLLAQAAGVSAPGMGVAFPDRGMVPSPSAASIVMAPSPSASDASSRTMQRVASRPSLVPRRPVEERRSMIGLNTLSKRMSSQSLMAMVVDGETPVKGMPGTPSNTEARRRIATSKSMHNLKTSGGARDSPSVRQFPPATLGSSRQAAIVPQSASAAQTSFMHHLHTHGRPSSSSAAEGSTRRSNSAASIAAVSNVHAHASPSKRPTAPARTSTAPPQLHSVASMSALSLYANGTQQGQGMTHQNIPSITSTAAPRWNMEDEENLPSPFIKKKASSSQPLRAIAAAQAAAATITGATMRRGMSSGNLSCAASGEGGGSTVTAPTVASSARQTRSSTARQSLGARLALHRQQAKVDEQGRRLAAS